MDIGSLTGQIALEDQLSGVLTSTANKIKDWAEGFDNAFGAIAISAGVAAAAIAGAAISIVALGDKGSDINDVAATLDRFAGSAENAEAILDKMRQGTLDTVDNMDLMKSSSKLLAAGLNLTADNFKTLSSAAFVLQNQGLGPTKDMLELVSQAMLTGRTRSLELKLGKMDLSHAEENFAKTLGITADKLSFAGKLEAKRIGLLEALDKKVKAAGVQERDFGEQLEFARTKITNWVDELAQAVAASPEVMNALKSIGTALQEAFGGNGEGAIKIIVGAINVFSDAVSAVAPYVVSLASGAKKLWDIFIGLMPVIVPIAAGIVALNAATILAETSVAVYSGVLMALDGNIVITTTLFDLATISVNTFATAVGALVAGVALGTWLEKNTKWARELSDSFEYASLRMQGFSATDADKAIALGHAMEEAEKHAKDLKTAATELAPPVKEAGKAHEDAAKYIDTAGKAAKAAAAELKKLTGSFTGANAVAEAKKLFTAIQGIDDVSKLSKTSAEALASAARKLADDMDKSNPAQKKYYDVLRDIEKQAAFTAMGLEKLDLVASKPLAGLSGKQFGADGVMRDAIPLIERNLMIDKLHGDMVMKLGPDLWKEIALTASGGGHEIAAHLGPSMLETLRGTFLELPDILSQAFEGGGGMEGAFKSLAVKFGADFGKAMSDAIVAQLNTAGGGSGSAFSGKTIGAAAGMGVLAGIGAASSGASTGKQIGSVATAGMNAGMMASMAGATTAASVAFAAYTAGAGLAVIAAYKIYKAMNDGRKVMQDYYKTFQGGADGLRQQMLVLGDAGEAMWIKLTQKTGKGDKKGALAIEAEINAALAAYANSPEAIAKANYQTRDDLQKVADTAKAVYEYMASSGKYTAEAIADAFQKSKDATTAAMSDEGRAHADAMDEITARYATMFDKIDTEYKSLSDSVAAEAEEAVMGDQEIKDRARMAQLEADKAVLEDKKAAEMLTAEETYAAWVEAGKTADQDLRELFSKGYDSPIRFHPESEEPTYMAGGGVVPFSPRGTDTVPAMLTPGETVVPAGGSRRGGTAIIKVNGRVLAEVMVPEIPGVVQEYGLG